ncbi:helix-turn-helix transcriptional regulator [Bifidobacterium moukalabense]|uniref:Transcriptional regulator, XRE family n=1 Tax=Bifidobacterium moukalabense DSM 27321 TaxID=1435051 RepID=W4NAI4_9BIFI|nr:helix-turn-helix transcriptional regulator [Bifidobacterium moukalabense]ETY71327.1 transcriptional regulator, XRE family [Bifidobacterium moukalabense DSM 27321]ETY71675.1 transcriptional regulator, XRE family [Bifidobacterium moukalabense DSM 27321]
MSIKALREKAGLSQQDLQRKAGLNAISRIWSWEAWDRTPRPNWARDPKRMSIETAKALADVLGVTLDDFYNAL